MPARRPIVLQPGLMTGKLAMVTPPSEVVEKKTPAASFVVPPPASPQPAPAAPAPAPTDAALSQSQAEIEWGHQRRLLQLMTDSVSDLIVLTDHQGHRTWNNPAYSRSLGYEAAEMAGTHVFSEVHSDDHARASEALNRAIADGTDQLIEYRVQQKNGGWIELKTQVMPVGDAEGKLESILLLSIDLTEKKKLEEALSVASTEATAAGMVEAMARDFDQILTNVVGNLTIAKNLNGPHNAIAVRLNEIERSLQRARDLIEQMFSISPQSGIPKVRIAVEPTVAEAVNSVLRGTMVRAEFLFPRSLPELEVDPEAFSHAIRNIVTNSLQAMDKGVVRFTAETISREQLPNRPDLPLKAGDYLCLHVQDQGHGISEKSLPRVFDPYFTTRNGSQGLGLTTALSSIQRMGGTIQIDSTPGVGTTVSVYLPAAQSPSSGAGAPMPTAANKTGPLHTAATRTGTLPKPGQKRRILLMDDEQMILDIVSRMLGHLGYDVTTCIDGSQAIAAIAKSKSTTEAFDVAMMDLIIPNGVGGQDAVQTIKKIDPNVRVIASSGHLDHPVMVEPAKHGFNGVLEKPYKLEKLQQVIEAVINEPAV